MPRKRMIDPNIWQSEDFSKLSTLAKLIFIGMFSLADDFGKGRAKPVYIKSVIFPYDDGMRIIDVEKAFVYAVKKVQVIRSTWCIESAPIVHDLRRRSA